MSNRCTNSYGSGQRRSGPTSHSQGKGSGRCDVRFKRAPSADGGSAPLECPVTTDDFRAGEWRPAADAAVGSAIGGLLVANFNFVGAREKEPTALALRPRRMRMLLGQPLGHEVAAIDIEGRLREHPAREAPVLPFRFRVLPFQEQAMRRIEIAPNHLRERPPRQLRSIGAQRKVSKFG
jgi:hypothetical protein